MSDSSNIDARWVIDAIEEIKRSIESLKNNGVDIPSSVSGEIMLLSFKLTKLDTETKFKIKLQFHGYD